VLIAAGEAGTVTVTMTVDSLTPTRGINLM